MTGSIAPNRPGHHGTVVARTVGTVAISCNVQFCTVPHADTWPGNGQMELLKVTKYNFQPSREC